MLSSLDEELETAQGNIEPEEQPSEAFSGTRREPVENGFTRATRYAEVQSTVLAYEIEKLTDDYPSLLPSLNIMTDALYAVRFEGDHEQAIDLFRTVKNNASLMDSHPDEDSSVGMPGLTPGNEEAGSDEESSGGMPDLIDRHDDSSKEDTMKYSVSSYEVTSDTESVTTVNEDSSVEESSIGTNESPVI